MSSKDDEQRETQPMTVPAASENTDWREYRARLVALSRQGVESTTATRWAHVLTGPEQGCVLVANPLMFNSSQTYFNQAVILIFEHTPNFSAGVILNKPSTVRLGDSVREGSVLLPAFRDNPLLLGGDVGEHTMHMAHSRAVEDSREVVRGVHMGGLEGVQALVARGEMAASDVKFFARYSGWAAGQLESECRASVWFPASVSAEIILSNLTGDGRHLWHEVMELLGDDFKRVSQQVRSQNVGGGDSSNAPVDRPQTEGDER